MTAGKTTRSAAKRSKLAVKMSEADKWKPRTDFRKEKRRPAAPAPQLRSTASAPSALDLFRQDYLKEFREKNPNDDKSSIEAVFRKASHRWRSLSDSDRAPYHARSFALWEQCRKAASKTVSYRETWDLKCMMEMEMDKMNL